jgi:hypothetical protein
MKFVLVNGRTLNPKSFCALCCESIGESYLRDLSTRCSYCDHPCYLGHRRLAAFTQATRKGLMTIVRVTNEPVPAAQRARQLCDHCSGPFGMVTHRWWGRKFCKRRCKDAHIRDIMLDIRRIHGWRDLLSGISLSRSAIPMVLRFAWNHSRVLLHPRLCSPYPVVFCPGLNLGSVVLRSLVRLPSRAHSGSSVRKLSKSSTRRSKPSTV